MPRKNWLVIRVGGVSAAAVASDAGVASASDVGVASASEAGVASASDAGVASASDAGVASHIPSVSIDSIFATNSYSRMD